MRAGSSFFGLLEQRRYCATAAVWFTMARNGAMSFGISHSPSLSKTLVLIITFFSRFLFTFFCLPIKCCLDSISELGFLNWVFRRLQSVAVGCRHDSGDVADFLMDGFRFLFWAFFLLLLGALSSRFSLVVAPVGSQRSDWRWPLVSMASFRRYLLVGPTNQPTDRPIEKKQQQ